MPSESKEGKKKKLMRSVEVKSLRGAGNESPVEKKRGESNAVLKKR